MNCRACGEIMPSPLSTYATYDERRVAACCIIRALKDAGVTKESVLQRIDDESARLRARIDQIQARLDDV